VLPPEEWPRLIGTELEQVWPHCDPAHVQVLVVEDGGVIVGTWMLTRMPHAECLWIAPQYRRHRQAARIGARLVRMMRARAQAWQVPVLVTTSLTPEVTTMITKYGGTRLPGEHFALPVAR